VVTLTEVGKANHTWGGKKSPQLPAKNPNSSRYGGSIRRHRGDRFLRASARRLPRRRQTRLHERRLTRRRQSDSSVIRSERARTNPAHTSRQTEEYDASA